MIEKRLIRWDDVYLSGFDESGLPFWGPRDEAVVYKTKARAHRECKVAGHRYPCSEPVVVRLKVKP